MAAVSKARTSFPHQNLQVKGRRLEPRRPSPGGRRGWRWPLGLPSPHCAEVLLRFRSHGAQVHQRARLSEQPCAVRGDSPPRSTARRLKCRQANRFPGLRVRWGHRGVVTQAVLLWSPSVNHQATAGPPPGHSEPRPSRLCHGRRHGVPSEGPAETQPPRCHKLFYQQ